MKINITEHIKRNKYRYMLALLVLVLNAVPMLILIRTGGHDMGFHVTRVNCIAQNIENGKWFAPIYYRFQDGTGYASPLFYGDQLLHIPGLLTYMGMYVVSAIRIFIVICFSATAAITYFCAKKIFKCEESAFIVSVTYAFSGYFATDFLTRAAYGEMQAFIFLPLVVLGFYSIIKEDAKYWYLLPVGMCGLFISHILTTIVTVVLLIIAALLMSRDIIKKWSRLGYLALSVFVFFVISAFFWMPMVEQIRTDSFRFTDGYTSSIYGELESNAMPGLKAFWDFMSLGKNSPWYPNGIGIQIVLCIGMMVYMARKKISIKKAALTLLATITILFMTSDLFLWEYLQDVAGIIQFPWRLLIFATLLLAITAGFLILKIRVNNSAMKMAMMLFTVTAISVYLISGTGIYGTYFKDSHIKKSYYNYTGYVYGIGAGEYLPSDTPTGEETRANGSKVNRLAYSYIKTGSNIPDVDSSLVVEKGFAETRITFEDNPGGAYVDIPNLMYTGYKAVLDTGEELRLGYGPKNRVRIYLGEHQSGTFTVGYAGTRIQTLSKIITVIGIICFIVYIILFRKILKKESAGEITEDHQL